MDNTQKIVLGSGKLYLVEFTGTLPADAAIEVESNRLGDIQGGASLKYTPTIYTVSDDLGLVKKTFLTGEDVTLTSGILTWNLATLEKLCSTARVTTTESKRTVKIGGIANYDAKSYVVRFVHATTGNRVTIVGQNSAGIELAFNPTKETVVNAEFKAQSMDNQGTLVTLEEAI